MKKSILIFTSLFLLASCGGTGESASSSSGESIVTGSAATILSAFMNPYHVSASGTETVTYPSPYSGMSYTASYSGNYDYGYLGSGEDKVKAIRDSSGLIHYADSDGVSIYNTLNAYNELTTITETRYAAEVLFADLYREPFSYLLLEDIDESTLALDPEKASFVASCYLGITHPVKEAHFTLDSLGRAATLEITYKTKILGLETSDATTGETVIYELEDDFASTISFSYEVDEFTALTPSAITNEALDSAFKATNENYTFTLSSNALSASPVYYVTEDVIYFHPLSYTQGLASGDIVYKYDDLAEKYVSYSYDSSSMTWSEGESLAKDDILLDTSSLSSAIYEQEGSVYSMIDEATYSAPISLVAPYLSSSLSSGYGLGANISLNSDGLLSSINLSFYLSASTISVSETYSNYGSTTLPSYLDIEEIGA